MKMNKRKLAVVSLIVCVAAIISMGSLAWFTADDSVENELKFVTDFSMDLYETDDDGNIVKSGAETIGRTYNNVRPGAVLHKDPTVVNKSSSEDQWIRMTVTVTGADVWTELGVTDLADIFVTDKDFDKTWKRYDKPAVTTGGDDKGTVSYTFYLLGKLGHGKTATLFSAVKIPDSLTVEQTKTIESCKIIIKAEAMQASDLGSGVTDAYTAFTNPDKKAK